MNLKNVPGKLTWDELINLTKIQPCDNCEYEHAIARTCEETREAKVNYNENSIRKESNE